MKAISNYHKARISGFTIVELLIVIVVIAILAAISIVAYNGIQQRARASAASSALTQSSKKISVWQVDNADTSPTCAQFYTIMTGATDSTACSFTVGDIAYQFSPGTTATGYCITATSGSTSYKQTGQSQPSSGGCPGHGQGGQQAITNLAVNPSLESDVNNWGVANWQGGNGVTTRDTSSAQSGVASYKMTWTTAATGTNGGIATAHSVVSPGTTYTFSVYVKPGVSTTINPSLMQYANSDGSGNRVDLGGGGTVSAPANTWTRISSTITVQAGFNSVRMRLGVGYTPAVNDSLSADSLMVTQGTSSYTYADGNSPNWIWNGTQNSSSSTGPPL